MSVVAIGRALARALSLRVIFLCLLGGVGFGVLVGLAWPAATMPAVWISAALLYLLAIFNAGLTRCDARPVGSA